MFLLLQGLPQSLSGKGSSCSAGDTGDLSSILGQEDHLEESVAAHSSVHAGESHGQTSLAGHSPWGGQELDTTEVT